MSFLLVLTLLLSLYGGIIGRFIPFNYFDEFVFLIFFVVGFCYIFFGEHRIPKGYRRGFVWFFLYLGLCLLSTIVYRYQVEPMAILKDIIAISKLPIIICFGMVIFRNGGLNKNSRNTLLKIIKVVTSIMFICSIINLFMDIGMSTEVRYGFRTFKFLFSHETLMVACVASSLAILMTEKVFNGFILMNLLILLLSFRDKALVLIILYLVVLVLSKFKDVKNKKAFVILMALPISLVVLLFTYDKIVNGYLSYGTQTARLAFIIHGFEYAKDSFPLGTGFATWANSPSGEYYSILYHMKNMETIYGIEFEGNSLGITYWNDTFWPSIYTQGGFFGLLAYLAMIITFFKEFLKLSPTKLVKNALYVLFGYALIASLLESYFTNDAGVTLALVLVLVINKQPIVQTCENKQIQQSPLEVEAI